VGAISTQVSFSAFVVTTLGVSFKHMCRCYCLSVQTRNSKTARPNHFCAYCLWPCLGPPLTALRYVMYFRFYV